jgi:hypothetical protein
MGITPLFCCFRNCRPNCIVLTAFIFNLITFALLIWGLCDISFRKGEKVLYIIGFILMTISLISVIGAFILLNLRNASNYITFNNIGKILCLVIIVCCLLAFIIFLIAEILIIKNYADIEDNLEKYLGFDYDIPKHDWCAAIIPGILALISSIIIVLCANILYKIFNDNIVTSVTGAEPNPVILNQNSMSTIPNAYNQNPIVISGNNAGILPPNGTNPPPVYQSGTAMNNFK